MATSPYNDTVFVMDLLGRMFFGRKLSVLDVGSGFGRWGFLLRCHLGCGVSLTTRRDQSLRIEAVEAFRDNITPIYDCVYDETHEGDVMGVLPSLGTYDVIIASHMLEHLPKPDGKALIEQMLEKSRSLLVILLPLGEWPQDEIHGNPFEVHRAVWHEADFKEYRPHVRRLGSAE